MSGSSIPTSPSSQLDRRLGGADLRLGHQLGERAGERVDLVRGELGAVAQGRRLDRQEALQAEQHRVIAAPLDRGLLGARRELGQRGVERLPAGGAGGERLGPLAVEQERLAGERRRTLDIGARWDCRASGNIGGVGHRRLWVSAPTATGKHGRLRGWNEAAGSRIRLPRELTEVREPRTERARIVITERMRSRLTLALGPRWRRLALPLVVAGCGSSGGRDGDSHPDYGRRWPARRRRWRSSTARRNQLLPGGKDAFEKRVASLGYPVVANVWASWCGPCRYEFPMFQEASAKFGKQVGFIGIDSEDSEQRGRTSSPKSRCPTRATPTPTTNSPRS